MKRCQSQQPRPSRLLVTVITGIKGTIGAMTTETAGDCTCKRARTRQTMILTTAWEILTIIGLDHGLQHTDESRIGDNVIIFAEVQYQRILDFYDLFRIRELKTHIFIIAITLRKKLLQK